MKRILALVLALVLCLGLLTACGDTTPTTNPTTKPTEGNNNPTTQPTEGEEKPTEGNDKPLAGTYEIKVWCPEAAVELTTSQIQKFNETNTDGITIVATVEAVGEGEAATQMTTDIEAGADIYFFAQDQAARLIQAGALSQLGVSAAEFVKTSNDASTVVAVTSGDGLWAYPLTSDNGYFMYYDKTVISDDIVDDLDALIAACEAAGKNFSFEIEGSAWYGASFFFGTGCVSEWVTDDAGEFISVNDTFNSTAGLHAAKAMNKLLNSPAYFSSSAGTDFAAAVPSAIVVTGTWDFETISGILGDNMGVADLPNFTVDGVNYHIGSYSGCKLLGVKPQTDNVKGAAIHKLAQYLTGEEGQQERFNVLKWGPSNLVVQASEEVKANPALAALAQQNNYAKPQGQIHGSWWDIGKALAAEIKAATDDAGLQAALDNYTNTMAGLFQMTDEQKNAWSVIGTIGGSNWTDDLPMSEQEDGTWKSNIAYEISETDEFKVRQGASWDNNYGADGVKDGPNVKVETAGTYYVVFDPATGMISVVPAE